MVGGLRGSWARPKQPRWSKAVRLAAVSALVLLVSATTTVVLWNRMTWTMSPEAARHVADQGDDPNAERAAVVQLLRETRLNIEALQRIVAGGGENAEQAKIALDYLRAQLR